MCHCRFINCNKCITLGDVDNGVGYACVGAGRGLCKFFEPSHKFGVTAPQRKSYDVLIKNILKKHSEDLCEIKFSLQDSGSI